MTWSSFSPGDVISSSLHNANFNNSKNELGEVRAFALSVTGSETKANLQANGWAICDGTTPAAQGIADATITATPDLQHKFIRMSNDESSGTTASPTHNHQWHTRSTAGSDNSYRIAAHYDTFIKAKSYDVDGVETNFDDQGGDEIKGEYYTTKDEAIPPYYELVYFIKVKLV
jgi:hypothetical protein